MTTSKQTIEDLLNKTKNNLEATRQQNIIERNNIYRDYWKSILKTEIDNQFALETRDNIKQMIDDSSNVLKRIIDEISIVYQEDAKRSCFIGQKEDENYKNILANIPSDLIMQEVNRFTNLDNQCLLYIVPRNKRIELDILTPDIVEVAQLKEDPTKPEAIIFTLSYVDTQGNPEIYYIYYDIYGRHFKFDKDQNPVKIVGNEDGKNPYKDPNNPEKTILPFVIFHKKYPINSIWDSTSGTDLISGTKQIGVLLTYLNYIMKTCSYKMLTFTGVDIKDVPQKLIFDPLFPKVVKDPAGSINAVDMQVDIEKQWNIICNKIGMLANNYGLSLDNFKLMLSAQSGFALKIKNLALDKIVSNQIKHYRYYEKELFEKIRVINNTMYPDKKISDNGVFKIDFAEPSYPEDPAQIREQWKFDIQMGAKTVYDYLMYINPDIKTIDRAKEVLKINVEANKQVATDLGIDIDKLLQGALSGPASPQSTSPGAESLI